MHACPCTGGSRGGPGDGNWVTKLPGGCPKPPSPPLSHPGFAIVVPRWLLAMGTPESRLAPQPSLRFGLHPSLLPLVQYFSSPQAGASRLLSLHDFSCSRSPPGSPGQGAQSARAPPHHPQGSWSGGCPHPSSWDGLWGNKGDRTRSYRELGTEPVRPRWGHSHQETPSSAPSTRWWQPPGPQPCSGARAHDGEVKPDSTEGLGMMDVAARSGK